jgi:hypothetical protein
MVAFFQALRRGPAEWRGWLLCCLGAPPIILFAAISAWSSQRVLFHWAAPGYLMLFPLLGAMIVRGLDTGNRVIRPALAATAVLVLLSVVGLSIAVRTDWLYPLIARFAPRTDPILEAIDWTSLHDELSARGLLARPNTVVAARNWRDGGKIARGLGPGVPVIVLDRDARQFGITRPAAAHSGQDVLILTTATGERGINELASRFDSIEPLPPIAIRHAGRMVAEVTVALGHRMRPLD